MTIITFNCTVLSPIFIGNAATNKAELRPPAFEGALRFWWRAIHPNLSARELRQQETEFFGGSYKQRNTATNKDETVNCLPSYRFVSITQICATNNVKLDARPDIELNRVIKMQAIDTNNSFEIKLCILKNEDIVKALFYITSALGGVGQRARRGTGAWAIDTVEYSENNIGKWIKKINPKFNFNKTSTNNFPYLKNFQIGLSYENETLLRQTIMRTAHNKKENNRLFGEFLGKIIGGKLASPVYVSIIKSKKDLKPIISQLNSNRNNEPQFVKEFKENILKIENES